MSLLGIARILKVGIVVAFVVAAIPLLLASQRRFRHRRAHRLMPRWPDQWPHLQSILRRKNPRGVPARAPHTLKEWVARIMWYLYWWPQHFQWRTDNGYLATARSADLVGSGAIRIGRLLPSGLLQTLCPLEVWIPRDQIYRHIAVAGVTGSGKTTTIGVTTPFHAAYSASSVFVNDVKLPPEYFPWFVDHFRRHGNHAINFNPWTPGQTLCWEPLHAATREQLDIIADALVTANSDALKGGENEGNQFFVESAKQMLKGVIILAQFAPRRYCTIPTLYQIIAGGGRTVMEFFAGIEKQYPSLEATEAAARTILATPAAQLEAEWRDQDGTRHPRSPAVTDAVALLDRSGHAIQTLLREQHRATWSASAPRAGAPLPEGAPALARLCGLYHDRRRTYEETIRGLGSVIDQPEQTFGNIVQFARNFLAPFEYPEMRLAFSRPEFDLREVIRRPTLCVVGAPMAKAGVGARFISSLSTKLMLNLVYERGKEPDYDHAAAIDVLLLLDEMPQLGLKDLARILATIRSNRGVVLGIFQSDSQLKEAWGDGAGTVLDNFTHQQVLYGQTGETAKRAAERVGEAVMLKRNTSRSSSFFQTNGQSGSVSESAERVHRMTEQDVTNMVVNGRPRGEMTALSIGKITEPFLFELIPYWEDPFLLESMGATRSDAGRWSLPMNMTPFRRTPLHEVQPVPGRRGEWEPVRDAAGAVIPDAHAHDIYRDTVDAIVPPSRPILYELTEPAFVPADLGITPVTAAELQQRVLKKLAGPNGQVPGVPTVGGASHLAATPTYAGTPPRSYLTLVLAAIDAPEGLPTKEIMPAIAWPSAPAQPAHVLAQCVRAAVSIGDYCRPLRIGELPDTDGITRVPLPEYFTASVSFALDELSWMFRWLRDPRIVGAPTADPQPILAALCAHLEATLGGVPRPPQFWDDLLDYAAQATPNDPIVDAVDRATAGMGRASSANAIMGTWIEGREQVLAAVPEHPATLQVRALLWAELLVDYAAYARAVFVDIQQLASSTITSPKTLAQILGPQTPGGLSCPMPTRGAIVAALQGAPGLVPSLNRDPRLAAAHERLGAAADDTGEARAIEALVLGEVPTG